MTKQHVLKNLKKLIGFEFNANDVICAFEDFEENGKNEVIVSESSNTGYDFTAYINDYDSTQFLFKVNENNFINDVWIA